MIRTAIVAALTAAFAIGTPPLSGQSKGDLNAETSFEVPETTASAMSDLALAVQLANYGYANGSPEALVAAARILLGTPASGDESRFGEGVAQSIGGEEAEMKEAGPLDLDPAQLLQDAAAMPGGADLSATIQRLTASPRPRGAVGGPIYQYVEIEARTTRWFTAAFRGREYARIDVMGDGDTDLDCWVYDENGNLIDSDTDTTDWCILEFVPQWTGNFTLKITNFGYVWNGAIILSN